MHTQNGNPPGWSHLQKLCIHEPKLFSLLLKIDVRNGKNMQSDEAMNDNLEQRSCSRMRTISLELPKLVTRPTNKNVSNKNGMFYVKE